MYLRKVVTQAPDVTDDWDTYDSFFLQLSDKQKQLDITTLAFYLNMFA